MTSLETFLQNTPDIQRTTILKGMIEKDKAEKLDVSSFKKFLNIHYPDVNFQKAYKLLKAYGVEMSNLFPRSNDITNYFKGLLENEPLDQWLSILREEIKGVKIEKPKIDSYTSFCEEFFPGENGESARVWLKYRGIEICDFYRSVIKEPFDVKNQDQASPQNQAKVFMPKNYKGCKGHNKIINFFQGLLKDKPLDSKLLILTEEIYRIKKQNPKLESFKSFCNGFYPDANYPSTIGWFKNQKISISTLYKNVKIEDKVSLSSEIKIEIKEEQSISIGEEYKIETILGKRAFSFEKGNADIHEVTFPMENRKKIKLNKAEHLIDLIHTNYKPNFFPIPPFPDINNASVSAGKSFIQTECEKDHLTHSLT